MQTANKSFKINIPTSRVIISLKSNTLKITLINYSKETVYQQNFDQKNLPSATGATGKKFINTAELYSWLERYRDYPQAWKIESQTITLTFQPTNILTLVLDKFDAMDLFLCFTQTVQIKQHIDYIYTELQASRQREEQSQKQNKTKLKNIDAVLDHLKAQVAQNQREIEVVEEKDKKRAKQLQKLINSQNQTIMQLEQSIHKKFTVLQQSFKQHKFQAETSFKTAHRNLMTVKQEFGIACQLNKNDIKQLNDYVMKVNLEQIKANYTQIKIKEYRFKPDTRSLQQNKKVYFLNQKSLKCVEDTKDYFKIGGTQIYHFGKYICRFLIKNIKNNGLLVGVCSNKSRNQLSNLPFNDKNLISLNSCGYVVNKGAMIPFSWKIKPGDQISMLVCTSTNEIKWICNNIELAHAELGSLRDEQIFPFIGLGNFCDQVQILQDEQTYLSQQSNLSYAYQLARLNEKFGNRKQGF